MFFNAWCSYLCSEKPVHSCNWLLKMASSAKTLWQLSVWGCLGASVLKQKKLTQHRGWGGNLETLRVRWVQIPYFLNKVSYRAEILWCTSYPKPRSGSETLLSAWLAHHIWSLQKHAKWQLPCFLALHVWFVVVSKLCALTGKPYIK